MSKELLGALISVTGFAIFLYGLDATPLPWYGKVIIVFAAFSAYVWFIWRTPERKKVTGEKE